MKEGISFFLFFFWLFGRIFNFNQEMFVVSWKKLIIYKREKFFSLG